MVTKSSVQPDTLYKLRVKRSVPYGSSGRVFMTPATDNIVKGKVISTISDDAIDTIEDIVQPES
jgi:hypothetical protein